MSAQPQFDCDKLKALVHYVCWKCDPDDLGSTKLNKVLWYSDMQAYLILHRPITGETYVKRQFGPVSSHIMSVIRDLEREGRLLRGKADYFGRSKHEFIPLTNPDLSSFTAAEISLVDSCIEFVCQENTATSISQLTHDTIWKLADIGEEIPYYTVWASKLGEVTPEDITWARNTCRPS